MDRSQAPVFFNGSVPDFSNQQAHRHMDFTDPGFRLLGLFRLWNAMNYYFPHLDVLDVKWNDLLVEFIPRMLEGTDRLSYELTLAAMARHLHDAHVFFGWASFHTREFGQYVVPVQLLAAEGQFVVYQTAEDFHSPFIRGDVVLALDGRDIHEIAEERLQFLSYPNDEKTLAFLAMAPAGFWHVLRSHTPGMEVCILRSGASMTLDISGVMAYLRYPQPVTRSHVILDGNIGLINPGMLSERSTRRIMESLADTDGIIIDLRQRPSCGDFYLEMRQYLMEEPLPFVYLSRPSQARPGAREDTLTNQYLPRCPHAFIYDRPVVLLMDISTVSHPEWAIMSFRTAQNVTVMGPFSMGANGNAVGLPLPGGITMSFTSLGVYTPERGQTHRIGLTPDIRVDRTIQGIAEGRDEIMEAAIQFILSQESS